jgi:hypothetical protein
MHILLAFVTPHIIVCTIGADVPTLTVGYTAFAIVILVTVIATICVILNTRLAPNLSTATPSLDTHPIALVVKMPLVATVTQCEQYVCTIPAVILAVILAVSSVRLEKQVPAFGTLDDTITAV